MNKSPELSAPALDSLGGRFEAICDGFEAAWKQGPVRIEDFLTDARGVDRAGLLAELLALEIDIRRKRGEKPNADEYLVRFPEASSLIAERFQAALAPTDGTKARAGGPPPERTLGFSLDAAELSPGSRLGEYEILAKLGQGGMGAVYQARHLKLKRVVALKTLNRERGWGAQIIGRFEREMEALGQLDHLNIVRAYDAREIGGTHFLVMEYVQGYDLDKVVGRIGPLPVADACETIRQAAVGLQYAHERSLVHRDIKPSNLILTCVSTSVATGSGASSHSEKGIVKILDLGLARLNVEGVETELTGHGQAMGTADYMSPEQVTDCHTVDIRSDIYALGCTLYKLLTGNAPFHGPQYRTVAAKMVAHATASVPPIRELRADVPKDLAAVIGRMLAKRADDRHTTPAAVVAELERFCRGADLAILYAKTVAAASTMPDAAAAPTEAHVASAVLDTNRSQNAPPARPASPSSAQRKPSPRRYLPWVAAAVALALLAGGAWALIIRIRDKKGDVVAEVKVPEGGSVETLTESTSAKSTTSQTKSTPTKSTPATSAPTLGQTLLFDGGASYVETPVIYDGSHPLTIEAWVTLRGKSDDAAIAGNHTGNDDGVLLECFQGRWLFGVRGAEWVHVASDEPAVPGRRTHLAGVYDGQQVRLYVDGKPQHDVAEVGKYQSIGTSLMVGALRPDKLHAGPHRHFLGLIGPLRISRTARYAGPFTPVETFTSDADTLAVYRFDDVAGTIAPDASSAKLDGAVRNPCLVSEDSLNPLPGLMPLPQRLAVGRRWQVDTVAPFEVNGLNWSPDGRFLSCGSGNQVRVFDAKTFRLAYLFLGHTAWVLQTRFSPDGQWLASCGDDGTVRLWSMKTGLAGPVLRDHKSAVRSIAWSPDSKRLASGAFWGDSMIRIWNVDGALERSWPGIGCNDYLSWSSNGKWIAASCNAANAIVRVWNLAGETVAELKVGLWTRAPSFSPDSRWLVTCACADKPNPRTYLQLWDTQTWKPAKISPDGPPSPPNESLGANDIVWSRDGKQVASIWQSATVVVWKIDKNQFVFWDHAWQTGSLACDPQFHELVAGYRSGLLRCWDLATGGVSRQLGFTWPAYDNLSVSPDDGRVMLFHWENSPRLISSTGQSIPLEMPHILWPAWSTDGALLAAVQSGERTVRLWTSDGKPGPVLEADNGRDPAFAWHSKSHMLLTSGFK